MKTLFVIGNILAAAGCATYATLSFSRGQNILAVLVLLCAVLLTVLGAGVFVVSAAPDRKPPPVMDPDFKQRVAELILKRRAEPLPMRPFHPDTLRDPGSILKDQRETALLRAVMLVVENHLTSRTAGAGAEDAQRFPSVAAHRAGAMESLATLHGAICRIVDGKESFVVEQTPES